MTQCDFCVRDQFSHTPESLVAREGVSWAVWGSVDGGKSLGFPLELEVCLHVVLLPVHPLVAHQPLLLLLLHPHPPAHVAARPRSLLWPVLVVGILLLVVKSQSLCLLLVARLLRISQQLPGFAKILGGRWLLSTRKSRRLNLCKSTFEM